MLGSLLGACSAGPNTELAVSESELRSSYCDADECVPVDSADTVPDGIDEDCDGETDEDVDATRANCPPGLHVIEGTRGDDVLRGTRGRDCILGYGGNDTIFGLSGDDLIFGGPGDDVIFTGRGHAIVRAGRGDDRVDASGSSSSLVFGEAGADTLKGGRGNDRFFGGPDNDVIDGGGGADRLNGGDCHDRISGGGSIDFINGGDDFDSCEDGFSFGCERSRRTRSDCQTDADCPAAERCAVHSSFCVPRGAAACGGGEGPSGCTPTGSPDSNCDGVDDDCDGAPDDAFEPQPTQCGAGSCSATGMTSCLNGTVQDSCRGGTPRPGGDATCDAIDDDCDGRVDEGFVGSATRCGTGMCAGVGDTVCVNGMVNDTCQPSAPSSAMDATCDGRDDDCDGSPDDDYVGQTTRCGVGACASTGTTGCVAGRVVDSCEPGDPNALDSNCDGRDDDCDGTLDEDFVPAATSCGVGQCAATGASRCSDGVLSDSCTPRPPSAQVDSSCDGRDDDCDGEIDEEFAPYDTTCGYGTCTREGRATCQSGRVVDSCRVDCEAGCNDGIDDDGDGQLDCADADCAAAAGCLQGSFGSPCTTDSQCDRVGPQGFCVIGVPGGYCSRLCGSGCPSGTYCIAGTACVVECGPGENCGRAGYACGQVDMAGLPPEPWCHPTCVFSCPAGFVCNADTNTCELSGSP